MTPRRYTTAAAAAVSAAVARPAARMPTMRFLPVTSRATMMHMPGAGKLAASPELEMNTEKKKKKKKAKKAKNVLLTFDAFGTLFRPRMPVAAQYAAVARACGLTGFDEAQLGPAFRAAYKRQAADFPNFGLHAGMGAEKWWTEVIHATFRAALGPEARIPWTLAPSILHRYSSAEAYCLAEPALPALLRSLKSPPAKGGPDRRPFGRLVMGVITNSDDRVPLILADLGFTVGPLRGMQKQCCALIQGSASCGTPGSPRPTAINIHAAAREPAEALEPPDIDFCCMSHQMGFEKPHPVAFQTAHDVLVDGVLGGRLPAGEARQPGQDEDPDSWVRIHVGDDPLRDALGALRAGWNAVLLDPKGEYGQAAADGDCARVEELLLAKAGRSARKIATVKTIKTLVEWLRGDRDSLQGWTEEERVHALLDKSPKGPEAVAPWRS